SRLALATTEALSIASEEASDSDRMLIGRQHDGTRTDPARPGSSDGLTARVIDATPPPPLVRAQESIASILPPLPLPLLIWALGAGVILVWLTIGRIRLALIATRATPLGGLAWTRVLNEESRRVSVNKRVQVLSSAAVSTPLTWGSHSPKIVLPMTAVDWPEGHRRIVLRHELAHIARGDALAQLAAGFVCVLYWFHPLVWFAQRRLRVECERACDDTVVVLGAAPAEYASHLLAVGRSARAFGAAGFLSVAMARTSQLEGRLVSVLDQSRRRVSLSRSARSAASLLSALLLLPLAAFQPVSKGPSVLQAEMEAEPMRSAEMPRVRRQYENDRRTFRQYQNDRGTFGQHGNDRRTFRVAIPGPDGETLYLELRGDGRVAVTGLDAEEVAELTESLRQMLIAELRRANRIRRQGYSD
ncbi:MAG TPA: M56 family metallopeptidase, partial [Gemmatimonadaceae bacterium]|nr:M56 family metallopeptidase [Gemmatimonadaceae bacterium]